MKNKNKFILIIILIIILFFGIVYKIGSPTENPKEIFLIYRAQVGDVKNFSQLEQINQEYFSENLMLKTKQNFNFEKLSEQEANEMIKQIKNTLFVSGAIKDIEQKLDDKKTAELIISFDTGKTYQIPLVFEDNSWKFATFQEYPEISKEPNQQKDKICIDQCGDGICQEVVCMGEGCPCAETPQSCPQDCK